MSRSSARGEAIVASPPRVVTESGSRDEVRTRGGWIPAGTAAERRANQSTKGTARGQRTRRKFIDAARRVFERDGFLEANIDDIVTEAGMARGSFYTYFTDKLHVFQILAAEVSHTILSSVTSQEDDSGLDPVERLDRSNRRYISAYRENAAIYGLIEQLATIDDVVRDGRLSTRRAHVARVAATIERWQGRGLADPSIDTDTTAAALVSMTSNFCYWWLVGHDHCDEDRAARAITEVWIRTLDLRRRPRRVWLDSVAGD